jgi:hypothetical protein
LNSGLGTSSDGPEMFAVRRSTSLAITENTERTFADNSFRSSENPFERDVLLLVLTLLPFIIAGFAIVFAHLESGKKREI